MANPLGLRKIPITEKMAPNSQIIPPQKMPTAGIKSKQKAIYNSKDKSSGSNRIFPTCRSKVRALWIQDLLVLRVGRGCYKYAIIFFRWGVEVPMKITLGSVSYHAYYCSTNPRQIRFLRQSKKPNRFHFNKIKDIFFRLRKLVSIPQKKKRSRKMEGIQKAVSEWIWRGISTRRMEHFS